MDSVIWLTVSRSGYLWLATEDGLVSFDGARFQQVPLTDDPATAHRIVTFVFEDPHEVLWMTQRSRS